MSHIPASISENPVPLSTRNRNLVKGVPQLTEKFHFYNWNSSNLSSIRSNYKPGQVKDGCNRGHGLSAAIKLGSLAKTVGASLIALWCVLSSVLFL